MNPQFRFRQTVVLPNIKTALLRTLAFATAAIVVVGILALILPERPFWVDVSAVVLISAAVIFRLQLALYARDDVLRDTQKDLQQALRHDSVMGTMRAKEFADSIEHAIDRRRMSSTEISDGVMLILKVGNFDEIRRRYGLQWADTLLQSIVRIVYSSVRYGDLVARLASDELGIFLPSTTAEDASNVCERILTRVREATFTAGQERQILVTVQLGGTRVGDEPDFQALREAASLAAAAEEEAGSPLFRERFS